MGNQSNTDPSTAIKPDNGQKIFQKEAIDASASLSERMVDYKVAKRIFDSLPGVLSGRTTGIEVVMQDGLLDELYESGLGVKEAYPQLGRLIDLLAHANPRQKIIEIGAGTGGASRIVMDVLLARTGTKRYRRYRYSDISSAFLANAKLKFSTCRDIDYSVLDIEKCPIQQGYQSEYDLVIASEALHATADIKATLQNARKLLRPGGKMLLIETTRPTLGHGLVLGTFSDYWIGSEEYRKESPFLDALHWQIALIETGFSGLDICLDDYPPPYTVASVMLATAVEPKTTMALSNGPSMSSEDSRVIVVNLRQQNDLAESIATQLDLKGFTTQVLSLEDSGSVKRSRIVLLLPPDGDTFIDIAENAYERIKQLIRQSSSMLWVTMGGLLNSLEPKAAIAVGLLRVLRTENPSSRFSSIDLDPSDENKEAAAKTVAQIEKRLRDPLNIDQAFAYFDGMVHLSRLQPSQALTKRSENTKPGDTNLQYRSIQGAGPVEVAFQQPGSIKSMYFQQDISFFRSLNEGWVEIESRAIGLNWKVCSWKRGSVPFSN